VARRSAKSKTRRSVDFSQEVKYFEADSEYEVEVKSAAWEDGNEHPYIAIVFKGTDDENEDSELYHNASVSPKALSRTRIVLEALGIDCPVGEAIDIDTEELVGARCMVHTYLDKYKGNDGETKSSVKADDFWPVDDKKGGKKKAGKKDADEDEPKGKKSRGKKEPEVEKIARDDVEGLSRKKLIALIEEHDLDDVDPDSRKLKKDDEALAAAVIEALEEKDLLEDDEPPAKGKGGRSSGGSKGSKGKSKTWTEDAIDDMDEDELEKVIEEAEIDVDLEDFRTLRKKKNAVKDALEEAGKIAE
jgi:hypothetical protein